MSTSTAPSVSSMVSLTIDGKSVTVPKGTTVYHACKQLGIEIPIFCYLDRLPPFGACRVCLVEVEKMAKPQTSCTLEATEGMVVKTTSQLAEGGRKSILELLLVNHPLDCPICDRAGECPLQENVLKYGPGLSRFFEEKRKFEKHLPLGPVLMLDRERCISCARCTRFGDELAGDHALTFIDRGYKTEVGTPGGKPVDSKFIGNTIMICPVGALTSQVYRFQARPWDNTVTQSTCTLCPVGCSMFLDQRDGKITRTRSCENKTVNDIWLCDKGWFGYSFAEHSDRLTEPLIRRQGRLEPASWEEALSLVAMKMNEMKSKGRVAAFGGNSLTLEESYLFQQLMRQGCGVTHLDHRIGMPLFDSKEEKIGPGMEMTIGECEELDFAVLMGLDLTEHFPVLWLRLRQAINKGADVRFIGHFAPEISSFLKECLLHAPNQEESVLTSYLPTLSKLMKKGGKGAIFVGEQYLAHSNRKAILSLLEQFQKEHPSIKLNIMEGRGNSMGARLAGMLPDRGPFGKILDHPGLNALQVIQTGAKEGWDFLYVAGANPALKFPEILWNNSRANLSFLVVQDLFLTKTAAQADVVLPTLCYLEKGGSFVNIEGRVQELFPGKELPDNVYSDAEIFTEIAKRLNVRLKFDRDYTALFEEEGIILKRERSRQGGVDSFNCVSPASGGMAASYSRTLFDLGERMEHDLQLRQVIKEPFVRLSFDEGNKRGIKEGQLVELSIGESKIIAKAKLDTAVAPETIVIPKGFERVIPVHNLANSLINGQMVEIKACSK